MAGNEKKKIRISTGIKSAVVYTIANVVTRGLAIITVPIFTRIMTTAQIGQVNLYNSWYGMISAMATLSLTSGGFSVAMKEFEHERDQYLSSVLTLTTLIAVVISLIYFINPTFWNSITGLPTAFMLLILIGLIVAPARDFWFARQRYEYKYKLSGILSVSSAIAAAALSVIAVMHTNQLEKTAEIRLVSNYIIVYGVALCIWIYIFIKGKKFVDLRYWKFSLALSVPLIGYSIASQVLSTSDRIMIGRMVSDSAVGIYGTIYSVSSIFTMVWTAINASFVPYLYQNINNKGNKTIREVSFALIVAYAFVAIFLVLIAPEIVKILATEEYYEAIYIMPPIAAGVFLTAVSNMYSNVLLYLKSSKHIMYAAAIAATANVVLNYIFIKTCGYMAAAYTTMVCYVIMTALLAFWANGKFSKEGDSLGRVYYNKRVFLLCLFVSAILLSGILLYNLTILRYVLAVIFLIGATYVGKKYIKTVKRE